MIIDELRPKYRLKVLLKVANIKKSTYEYYKSKKHIEYTKKKNKEEQELIKKISSIYYKNHCRYGYIRVNLELNKEIHINQKRTQKLMQKYGLKGFQGKTSKFHTYRGDNGNDKDNLLLDTVTDSNTNKTKYIRNFSANKPNMKWATDVSEFRIASGKIYLSPILDMYDGSIISYDISTKANYDQTKRMLGKAFRKHKDLDGLILQSDQGWQYQLAHYQNELKKHNIRQSFSRKGNCMDNSLMENFFGIMKKEMFYGNEKEFKTLEELKAAMIKYINYYNRKRINKKRKGLSPLEYRHQYFSLVNEN